MKYIIRKFNAEQGQIVVEYAGQWIYSIDLPVENGKFPTGQQLEDVIQAMAPVWLLERKAALTLIDNAHEIQALVQPLPPPPVVENPVPQNAINSSDVAFINQLIADALAEKGL